MSFASSLQLSSIRNKFLLLMFTVAVTVGLVLVLFSATSNNSLLRSRFKSAATTS